MYKFNIEDLNFRKIVKDFLNRRNVTFYENAAVLEVKAQSLQKLSIYVKQNRSYIEYEKVSNILKDVVEIQKLLEKNNLCISYYDFDDIVVVNDEIFLFINDEKIENIENGEISIRKPISKDKPFLPPKITEAKSLPIVFHYKESYLSLALLTLKLLTPENKVLEFTEEMREKLYPTKLYWFLKTIYDNDVRSKDLIII
tara:strand:+ start:782 stop:1378 length:597 start_codon:yes stop_codon:yes gene_type:complete